jgi:hypothetical protein
MELDGVLICNIQVLTSAQYTGEIIIDPEAIHTYGTDIDSLLSKSQPMGNKTTNAGNFEEPSDFDGGPKWVNYNNIEWETQLNLTEHQLLLSPRHISGLALRVMSCGKYRYLCNSISKY